MYIHEIRDKVGTDVKNRRLSKTCGCCRAGKKKNLKWTLKTKHRQIAVNKITTTTQVRKPQKSCALHSHNYVSAIA